MEITTSYNVMDKVWVMKNNKPYQFKVYRIELKVFNCGTIREMYIDYISRESFADPIEDEYMSFECYATKKELLDSFLKDDV